MEVKIVNKSNNLLPGYSTEFSAGMDLRAFVSDPVTINPGEISLIPTGLFLEIPEGYEAQVRPRSGLALKFGISVLNSPGTIDSDYRGEVCVILINHGKLPFEIGNGDRIAQIVFSQFSKVEWKAVECLSESDRGVGGFGHTGH